MSEAHEIAPDGEVLERDYEAEARQLGWHPLEEFRGDPADFVDAKAFVTRGETRLPILQENNRKLMQRVRRGDDENAAMRTQLDEMNTSLKTLRTMAEKSNEAGYQRALTELKAQQRQAVADGDVPRFEHIQGEIEKVEATREETQAPPQRQEQQPPKGPKGTPEFQAWLEDNKDWVHADQALGATAVRAELELRNSDEDLTEAQIWERVTEMVKGKLPRRFARATGSAEQVSPSSGSAPRRAAGVLAPSGGAPHGAGRKGGIDSIQDPNDRKEARAAYEKIRRGIKDYTEAEYMKVWADPKADVIEDAIKRKVANGQARPN